MIKKLRQDKINKNLIRLYYDTKKDIYILNNRLKHHNKINKKYIITVEKSKDLSILEKKFNELIENLTQENNKIIFDNTYKEQKWGKYSVSNFYK